MFNKTFETLTVLYSFVAPDCDDSLTFSVTYAKVKKKGLRGMFKTRKDSIMEINLEKNVISQELKEHNKSEVQYTLEKS